MRRLCTLSVIAGTLIPLPAYANDSTARVATGGITLLKSQDIRMAQEVLDISQRRIRVQYRFVNESAHDVLETVAFPMPPYGWNPGESALDANERPMRSFVVRVDGRPVPARLHREARHQGRDITAELRALGLSDRQIFETFGDQRLDGHGLTAAQQSALKRLLNTDQPTSWQVAETWLWEQLFPPGRELRVEHEYQPFVGMIYTVPHQRGYPLQEISSLRPARTTEGIADPREACVDEGAQRSVTARVKALAATNPEWVQVNLADVEYVLGTGRNWRGPIGDFKLLIRKDSPDEIVSLCFPGQPRRSSPTTLEFSQKDFVPQDKLVVYFYKVTAKESH